MIFMNEASAGQPPKTVIDSGEKPRGLKPSTKDWELAWSITTSPLGTCEDLAGGGKKCIVPSFPLQGKDWVTTIGLTPTNHFLSFTQATMNSVTIEMNYDYGSPVRAAFDPDVKFFYRLKNENGAILATIEYDWWRKIDKHNEHRLYSSNTPNINIVKDIRSIDVYVAYRNQVNW